MTESDTLASVCKSDFLQLCADGASNAIGSAEGFEFETRNDRANDMDLLICSAHQNERSGGKASGTIKFASGSNDDLGLVLKKSHEIQWQTTWSTKPMNVYRGIQEKKARDPCLVPDPANEVRWQSKYDETDRANIIMGDVSDSVTALLSPDGNDYSLLTDEERASEDTTRLAYTDRNKKVL
ncbi:hypothetical protein ACHAWF_005621 [Thalassiosira exigua]